MPRVPSIRGRDNEARAKAPTASTFSSKWRYMKDVGLYDLRSLLFKCSNTEGNLQKIKGYDKDDLLSVVQYITGLDPSEPLETRNRTFASHWSGIVFTLAFWNVDCLPLVVCSPKTHY